MHSLKLADTTNFSAEAHRVTEMRFVMRFIDLTNANREDSMDIALVSGFVLYLLFVWIVSALIIQGVYLAGLFNSAMLSLILVAIHSAVAFVVYGDGTPDAPIFEAMKYLNLDLPKAITGAEIPPDKK